MVGLPTLFQTFDVGPLQPTVRMNWICRLGRYLTGVVGPATPILHFKRECPRGVGIAVSPTVRTSVMNKAKAISAELLV